ncbi:hypothetical protein BU25DRAFT_214416 [Macroventuria anomochaeta]|uniref:Uncharacterized protein n=1 Tax=Macroventuria anomochaeta TaxID=301207 RepID=A0ACB6RKK2_9PLEO|nr:uncharacterized protein BU25DRAFT_214416 [Macroventuria anomochaeta]KAF2622294.1 hypothetical protein BU25DRAFT_214416 [Macroventuria anomochaeta]
MLDPRMTGAASAYRFLTLQDVEPSLWRGDCFLLLETEPALSTCATPPQLRCWALHARHLDQASPWLVACNAKSARLGPSWLCLLIMAAFSTLRGALVITNQHYLRCGDSCQGQLPIAIAVTISIQQTHVSQRANVEKHPKHSGQRVSSECLALCTDWRHVRNLRAIDDTCDGLRKSSHTLVFQSTAGFPPSCRADCTPDYFCVIDGRKNEEPLLSPLSEGRREWHLPFLSVV